MLVCNTKILAFLLTSIKLYIFQTIIYCVLCRFLSKYLTMDPAVLAKLEKGWESLSSSDSKSLLKKYLSKEVFEQLKNKKTSFGSTLLDCVQSGKSMTKICIKNIYFTILEININYYI